MSFTPATDLKNRSYIGLVLSQFLASFNDQAIHIVAIFYASDMLHGYVQNGFDQKLIVSIVTACFISPFFLFSPVAGILADNYSKRRTIIFWKVAEIFITGLTLFGFLLPHIDGFAGLEPRSLITLSAALVVTGVFLMGTHSAFYGPAKYGIMPEMLHSSVLSRGNGLLEGTSFVSQILGTSFGGFLYYYLKSKIATNPLPDGSIEQVLVPGGEWIIGLVLFVLAFVGAIFSFFVARVPAASPDRHFTLNPLVPLGKNLTELGRSRPLKLATIGIAFFTFMTLFVRQTLLYQGESNKELYKATMNLRLVEANKAPVIEKTTEASKKLDGTWRIATPETVRLNTGIDLIPNSEVKPKAEQHQLDELWISTLVALVGLGVGIGCGMAGRFSGSRLELGLVPIGTTLLVVLTASMSLLAKPSEGLSGDRDLFAMLIDAAFAQWPMILCLMAVGFAAGLYIVPLYTMLQHRAPKDSKGNMIAISNFMNVTGGLLAIVVFYFSTYIFQNLHGNDFHAADVAKSNDPGLHAKYVAQLESQKSIPQKLFLVSSGVTLLILILFVKMRPDFLVRSTSLLTSSKRRSLRAVNADHLPSYGPLLLVSNCRTLGDWINVISVIDRLARFVCVTNDRDPKLLAKLSAAGGVAIFVKNTDSAAGKQKLISKASDALVTGDLLGISIAENVSAHLEAADYQQLVAEFVAKEHGLGHPHVLRLLPVYCGTIPLVDDDYHVTAPGGKANPSDVTSVVVGTAIDSSAPWSEIVSALAKLGK